MGKFPTKYSTSGKLYNGDLVLFQNSGQLSWSRNSRTFMEPEGSLLYTSPYSQQIIQNISTETNHLNFLQTEVTAWRYYILWHDG